MNKPIYIGLSILELSKTLMYEFWYGYLKPKYGQKSKILLCVYRHCTDIIQTFDFIHKHRWYL